MRINKNQQLARQIVAINDRIVSAQKPVDGTNITLEGGKVKHTAGGMRSVTKDSHYSLIHLTSHELLKLKNPLSFKLITMIASELKMNNPLWHCGDKSKSQVRKALKELEDIGVLLPIRGTDIYYVSPDKIVKGAALVAVLALTVQVGTRTISEVTKHDIVALKPPPDGYEIPISFTEWE